ncbi:hypothetical protein H8E77_04045 [bacterium]|nr:hypothetical protein [bacterium]
MRQSSVIKEILRKERIQAVISVLEVRFGEVNDAIKNSLASIQDEETLSYLLRQSVVTEKNDIEKKILALSA